MTIRLLLADDQALVRGALATLLGLEADLEVVAEVGGGRGGRGGRARTSPDVALVDVEMPGLDGIAATAALHEALPAVRVLIVTTFGRPGLPATGPAGRGDGFVVKDTPARQLAEAVRRVHAGSASWTRRSRRTRSPGATHLDRARDRGPGGGP